MAKIWSSWFLLAALAAPVAHAINPGEGGASSIGNPAEETFELRMERILKREGKAPMVARLQKELAQEYRPYVAAWVANYMIYGDVLGLPNMHDESAGLALARKAMDGGSLFGLELTGRALVDGRGVDQRQPKEGAELLQKAVDAGRYTAMGELAKLYYFGYGVPRNVERARTLARRAAYRGSPFMLYYLGDCAETGRVDHVPNIAEACAYYLQAAEWGQPQAQARLAALDQKGDKDAHLARQLLLLFELANGLDVTPSRIKQTVQRLEAEYPDDLRVLVAVNQLRMEIQLPVYDPEKAWAGLARATQDGDLDAQYFQAEMIRRGIGRKKDAALAVARLQALADMGNALAMGRLGWLYYWGADSGGLIAKDEAKAFAYVRAAAHAGDQYSILNLASMYEHGIGTEVNYYMSARYYSIAEDLGWHEATRKKNAALALIKD